MFVSGSESLGNSVPVYCSGLTSFDVRSWKISCKNFQGLLSIVQLSMFFVVAVSCDSFYIISKCFMFVNNFFKLFFVAFLNLSNSNSDILSYIFLLVNNFFEVFFKSYFQTKRRKRDSNPRAGCPTYTLSRGASSASWVFLLITVANYHLLSLSGELARRRINYTSYSSFCQQLFSSFFEVLFRSSSSRWTEKEGFEPSRRFPDLHP